MRITQKNLVALFSLVFLLGSVLGVAQPTPVLAQTFNQQINYQGKLTASSSVAVPDGDYDMVFALYTTATGSSAVWTESRTAANQVTVTDGLFSVMLGEVFSLSGVDFSQTLYLGVDIESDGEMTPRKVLGAVPAAFEAGNATTFGNIATSSFLRSDIDDTAAGLLTFSGGFISSASSTISELTTSTTTATTFLIDGEGYTTLSGGTSGLVNNSGTLTADISESNLNITGSPTNNYVLQASSTAAGGFVWAATSSLGFDPAGTDNSTDVTLAGENYLSINGSQQITANAIDLSGSNATGTLAAARFPALTGDITTTAGSLTTSIASGVVNVGDINFTNTLASNSLGSNQTYFGSTGILFEGATADGFEGLLSTADITGSDKTWTLPNTTGTLALLDSEMTGRFDGNNFDGGAIGIGDLLYGSAVGHIAERAIGTTGQILQVSGGLPVWAATSSLGIKESLFTEGGATTFLTSLTDYLSIGTTSENSKLTVQGNAGDTNNVFTIASSTGTTTLAVLANGDTEVSGNLINAGITWKAQSAAGDNDGWNGVTYGNGLFVAVGYSGDRVMTSPDGINWTARSAAGNDDGWSGVTYGNGLFVAVGDSGDRVMTSPDGITWTARSAAGDNDAWRGVTYGNGLFVAVGATNFGDDRVMTSPDGINWTARSAAGDNDSWEEVIYANGLFVAVANSGDDRVMTSPDGINWTARSAAGNDDGWSGVTYGNGLFVAVAYFGPGDRVMTSPDGITWTEHSAAGNNDQWSDITYGNGLFVAVASFGDSVMTSPDGITWTTRSAAGDNDGWFGVTYGNGLFVAVGDSGDRVMTSGNPTRTELAHNNLYQGGMSVFGQFNIGTTTTNSNILNIASTTGIPLLTMLQNGNIGIGTTSPNAKLTVAGNINIDDQSSGLSFMGTRFLYASTTNDSIAFGEGAGAAFNSNTNFNVALGFNAGQNASTSDNNTYIGREAGQNNTGSDNNFLGDSAGENNTGSDNNLLGQFAGWNNTGSNNNLFGFAAGANNTGSNNNLFGFAAGVNNTGSYSEFIGFETGGRMSAFSTVAIGGLALRGGPGSTFIGLNATTTNNTVIGYGAGFNVLTGGDNNLLLGYQAADNLTTGANNIVLGYDVDVQSATQSNTLNIGNLLFGTGIDGTGTTTSSGNIGIGTSTPSSKLTVAGSGYFGGALRATGSIQFDALTNGLLFADGSGVLSAFATSSLGLGDGTIGGLTDVDTTGVAAGSVLTYDAGSTSWVDTATSSLGFRESLFTDVGANTYLTSLTDNLGIGTTSPTAKLAIDNTGFSGAGVVGLDQYLQTTNSVAAAVQFGNRFQLEADNTATTTIVGSMYRVADNTTFGNTVRGLEVQTNRGSNTQGENTALSGFARTFGVRGVTSGDAGGSFEPAGGFFESEGTTQGNAIRGYSSNITSATLLSLFQDTSAFTGTGLEMNFGNTTGSFSSSTSKYLDFQNSGSSVFTVSAYGTTTIGDGTTNNMAGLQIGYGGICVDNDGSCTASTTGNITAVSYGTANSDLAENYFSSQSLQTGEIVTLAGGLSVARAEKSSTLPILGVVSTKPGLTLGFDDTSLQAGETAYPIALSGRVPVQLSTENGPIRKGDQLMLSSLPGVAMKATGTGATIGIALEDFTDSRMYSDTYLNQFGDDMVDPVYEPVISNTDARINDGCYYGGGSATGEDECVPLAATTSAGKIDEVNAHLAKDSVAEQISELKRVSAQSRSLADGQPVQVGQIVMFVQSGHRWVDESRLAGIESLFDSSLLTEVGENENETLFDRLVAVANSFVDGVFSIFELRADRIEVAEELCVDGVCINAGDLRALLEASNTEGQIVDVTQTPSSESTDLEEDVTNTDIPATPEDDVPTSTEETIEDNTTASTTQTASTTGSVATSTAASTTDEETAAASTTTSTTTEPVAEEDTSSTTQATTQATTQESTQQATPEEQAEEALAEEDVIQEPEVSEGGESKPATATDTTESTAEPAVIEPETQEQNQETAVSLEPSE